ncbi:MAG: xylose isomerase [Verrucomicrobia bacterium]|nr:xylose isomerase [Verrucomicrobiota bacterium]
MLSAAMSYFPEIPQIPYEGPTSKNALAFKHYNPKELVEGKSMHDHLRFAAAYWHVMRNGLGDPFGAPTAVMPWEDYSDSLSNAKRRADVFFEFLGKLGIDFWCFHDRDVAPELNDYKKSTAALQEVTAHLGQLQQASGKKLLWGTACLFGHPRYSQGAGTSPNAEVFAYGAAQVKAAIDATHALGGLGYVFWGGREGYASLLNTHMGRELDHLAALLHLAVDYKRAIGFTGQFYIEPKPREPSTHQYDSDAAACLNFLREYDLLGDFKLNIETNHATLAGHTMEHELTVAINAGALGSIDANQGDMLIGWDTDQFPTDLYGTTKVMLKVLEMGGFTTGGLNFDAKRRRESHEPLDLFHAHIGGMDAFARGLKIAAAVRADGRLGKFVCERYASWNSGIGQRVENKKATLAELAEYVSSHPEPVIASGRQEMLENILNECIC